MTVKNHRPYFNPDFDDTEWTEDWLMYPVFQPPPMIHESGYRVEARTLDFAEVFNKTYRLSSPMEFRFLYDPAGRLWMSDVPQERIMMYNNARLSKGHVLVGGLGLGLYPQYALQADPGQVTRFTFVEESPVVADIIEPTLSLALDAPYDVISNELEPFLKSEPAERYDTIFIDTWDTMDAAYLPGINRLRDLAARHLAEHGRILLWGYAWMVRLFEDACRVLLEIDRLDRRRWLEAQIVHSPQAESLLAPVEARFRGLAVDDMDEALTWCREYIVNKTV